jgi:hypothetical protein
MRQLILIVAVVSGSLLLAASPVAADTTPGGSTPIVVNLTLDTVGSIDKQTGAVTVSGTITCDQAADGYIEGEVRQIVGRFHTVHGWFSASTSCSPEPARWSGSAQAFDGKFAGSSAQVDAYSYAYAEGDPPAQGFDNKSGTLRLRR